MRFERRGPIQELLELGSTQLFTGEEVAGQALQCTLTEVQLRVVTWTRSGVSGDDELSVLIGALLGHECDAALVQHVPRSWPRVLADALAGEYRQTPSARARPPLGERLRRRRSGTGDAVAVIARHDRIVAAQVSSLPFLAAQLAVGTWLVSAGAGNGEPATVERLRRAARSVLAVADGAPVVLAVAMAASPPSLDGLRHVAGHPGGHIFVGGPAEVTRGRATRAGSSPALIIDLGLG